MRKRWTIGDASSFIRTIGSARRARLKAGGEAGADFAGELGGFVRREAADTAEEAGEILPVQILYGEEVMTVYKAYIVDTANVGVADLAGDADFVAIGADSDFLKARADPFVSLAPGRIA